MAGEFGSQSILLTLFLIVRIRILKTDPDPRSCWIRIQFGFESTQGSIFYIFPPPPRGGGGNMTERAEGERKWKFKNKNKIIKNVFIFTLLQIYVRGKNLISERGVWKKYDFQCNI